MADETGEMTVAQRLGQLLDRGLLPAGGPAEAAERLIERLERPARIALLGLPGAGKSAVLNLLAGAIVVPEMLRLPTIVVQYGSEARMLCTLADGRTEVVSGGDLAKVLTLNPALVTLELDIPALKVISLLEVSAGAMEAEQRRAAIWASKRADIVIWCTTSYLPKEQVVWDSMPDAVKDNGFLFLTKVDLLGSREAAAGMLERVELRAGEEFRQVLSISAKQARAAMPPGGNADRELFRESGALAVITTIKTRVQMARRADTDMAELLLARHVEASSIAARRFAEPEAESSAPPAWAPPPEAPSPVPEPVANISQPELEQEPEPVYVAPASLVPDPEPEIVFQPEVEGSSKQAPEPEPAQEPPPMRIVAEPPLRSAAPSAGSKRFSDRIKQLPTSDDAAPAEKVPLRTTWKSRTETATPPATPRSTVPEPAPAPVQTTVPEPPEGESAAAAPVTEVPEAEFLEAEAPKTSIPRAARERPQRETGTVRATPGPVERPAARQLFGATKPGATASPQVDLSGLRERPTVESAAEPVEEIVATQPDPAPMPEQVNAPIAKVAHPSPVPETEPAEEPAAMPTPRAAVLRDRRPEAISSERRERPRIAARAVISVPPPPIHAQTHGPVTVAEQIMLDKSVAHIMQRAADLSALIDPEDKLPVDMILDHGRETVEHLIDVLSRATSPVLRRINGDLSEVLDLVMLMQLEKGHAPADDALTLLLQIRRDLETLRAA